MTKEPKLPRVETGVRNLDAILSGGLPKGSVVVFGGPPGAGKTILAQQISFHNASTENRVLVFNTLSEPTAKTLSYLKQFAFFDPAKLGEAVQFVDLGVILRAQGLELVLKLILDHLKKVKPAIVIIDSFRVFDDLAQSPEQARKFAYEVAVNLMVWETTAFLLGEYGPREYETNPLISVIDGVIALTHRESLGEQQRFLQVQKMRGTGHNADEHSFRITDQGIDVFAPRVTIRRMPQRDPRKGKSPRLKTGIGKLDDLLGEGIPRGSSLLVSGAAGTGKTVLLLEFVYRGAQAGEKGIFFSFEETEERLRSTARGLGWDLDTEIERGMIEIVFIPQPDILVEHHLLMMRERVEALDARRVAIDSASVFLHKIRDPQIAREKVFQLASIVQNAEAVGFFATDIPYGSDTLSRLGVEETVVDGVMLLSLTEEGLDRQRYIEVYKLRNTSHAQGRHTMAIGPGGIKIFPRYQQGAELETPPPAVEVGKRLPSGVPGLDPLLGGGLLPRSVTLASGSAGTGKTTLGLQFVLEGTKRREPGLVVSLEESHDQVLASAEALGLPLEAAVRDGLVEIVYLSPEHVRGPQVLAILSDKIQARKVRRLFMDAADHIFMTAQRPEEVRKLLYKFVILFKKAGVTAVLTLETSELHSAERVTDQRLSPIADNLVMLRYLRGEAELRPTLTVIKTRASAHDGRVHALAIGKGGLRIEGPAAEVPPPAPAKARKRPLRGRRGKP
jgi:circadian clock protein KaiC